MSFAGTLGTFTPYSSVLPLGTAGAPSWAPHLDRERVASYQIFEEIYWNNPTTFRLLQRGTDLNPVYIPNARVIVDTTAYFLMKDFKLLLQDEQSQLKLNAFLKREAFYNKFHIAKHSGCTRGDYVFHILADPLAPPSAKISIESIDPGCYFPIPDPDHPDKILGVDIVDHFMGPDGMGKVLRQRYLKKVVGGNRRISTELLLLEANDWWDEDQSRTLKTIIAEKLLPEAITQVPVYAFQNMEWQGQPFGSSELRGFERLFSSINTSAGDEETALALEGLGVYATDAPPPTNPDTGVVGDWVISPGYVASIPAGASFERVKGVSSIKPMQDHIAYLEQSVMVASGTFRPDLIDVQVAQSGIALAIRFLPMNAKLSERENTTIELLQQMMFDWGAWEAEYENENFGGKAVEVEVKLGKKLPENAVDIVNELNNMLDRKVISQKFYREEMTRRLGYEFPAGIDNDILAEQKAILELQQQFAPVQPNGSGGGPSDQTGTKGKKVNNKGRPNESKGMEAK